MFEKQIVVVVLSGFCVIAPAQETDPSKNQTAAVAVVRTEKSPGFNIDFPGGTPGELIQHIAKASGARPNVIIPRYVADVQIPKFNLQNVSIGQVFEVLNLVPDETGGNYLRWIGEGNQGDANRVWTLSKAVAKPSAETCQVVFIGKLLESYQLDDINAAIRTAWEMLGKPSNASLKFHKETKLLIAKGNGEELKLVFEVLKSLEQGAEAGDVKEPGEAKK